jgi:cysteine-rich repeat protein
MSTFCVDELCTTPASCEAAVCDGGRACTAEDSCECPAGTFVDGACCGDGVKQTREDCDDGASNSDSAPNACRTSCTSAACGDGVVDNGETCDLAAQNSDSAVDGCRTSCALASCGDGVVDTGETCDDDNTTSGDGCSASCKPEVTAIDCGNSSCCALFSDGRLKCWGSNGRGALGVDATLYGNDDAMLGNAAGEMGSALPTVLPGVTAFSVDDATGCAVSSGQLYCWGANLNGFIRGSPTSDVASPLRIDVGAPVKAVAVGSEHACAITTSDAVRCWGNNTDGQLATGNETPLYPVSGVVAAATINLGGTAKAVISGGKRSCALLSNDALKCWGDNFNGALGIGSAAGEWGSLAGETAPLALSFSAAFSVQQVDLGLYHSCAVSSQGTARCWGENEYGKLGIGSTTASNVPSADLLLVGGVQQIDAGAASTLALMSTGKVRVWGVGGGDLHGRPGVVNDVGNNPGEIGVLQDLDLGTGVLARSVSHGGSFACALTTDARVKCWGSNANGELGHGTTTPRGGAAGDMGDNLPYTVLD